MNNAQVHPLFASALNGHLAANAATTASVEPLIRFSVRIVDGQIDYEYTGLFRDAVEAARDGRLRIGIAGKVIVRALQ